MWSWHHAALSCGYTVLQYIGAILGGSCYLSACEFKAVFCFSEVIAKNVAIEGHSCCIENCHSNSRYGRKLSNSYTVSFFWEVKLFNEGKETEFNFKILVSRQLFISLFLWCQLANKLQVVAYYQVECFHGFMDK